MLRRWVFTGAGRSFSGVFAFYTLNSLHSTLTALRSLLIRAWGFLFRPRRNRRRARAYTHISTHSTTHQSNTLTSTNSIRSLGDMSNSLSRSIPRYVNFLNVLFFFCSASISTFWFYIIVNHSFFHQTTNNHLPSWNTHKRNPFLSKFAGGVHIITHNVHLHSWWQMVTIVESGRATEIIPPWWWNIWWFYVFWYWWLVIMEWVGLECCDGNGNGNEWYGMWWWCWWMGVWLCVIVCLWVNGSIGASVWSEALNLPEEQPVE